MVVQEQRQTCEKQHFDCAWLFNIIEKNHTFSVPSVKCNITSPRNASKHPAVKTFELSAIKHMGDIPPVADCISVSYSQMKRD